MNGLIIAQPAGIPPNQSLLVKMYNFWMSVTTPEHRAKWARKLNISAQLLVLLLKHGENSSGWQFLGFAF